VGEGVEKSWREPWGGNLKIVAGPSRFELGPRWGEPAGRSAPENFDVAGGFGGGGVAVKVAVKVSAGTWRFYYGLNRKDQYSVLARVMASFRRIGDQMLLLFSFIYG
jgi:hypothetical protein